MRVLKLICSVQKLGQNGPHGTSSETAPFDALAQHFARVVAENLQPLLAAAPQKRVRSKASGSQPRRKINMGCRYPGCKNRSKGPRFRFLCEEHLQLPKAEQNAALTKWEKKNG